MKINELKTLQRRGVTLKRGIIKAGKKEFALQQKYKELSERALEIWGIRRGTIVRARGQFFWVVDAECLRGFHVEPTLLCRKWIKNRNWFSAEPTRMVLSEIDAILLTTEKKAWYQADPAVMPSALVQWEIIKEERKNEKTKTKGANGEGMDGSGNRIKKA